MSLGQFDPNKAENIEDVPNHHGDFERYLTNHAARWRSNLPLKLYNT